MLGMFLVVPIFAKVVAALPGDQGWAGLALGAYALAQALLMIPFSLAAGRRSMATVTCIGMGTFCLGSVAAALASSVGELIVARAIQGAGAVSGVAMMVLESQDGANGSRAAGDVATISFALSLVLGPLVYGVGGFSGISWMLAIAAAGLTIGAAVTLPRTSATSPVTADSLAKPGVAALWGWGLHGLTVLAHLALMAAFATISSRVLHATSNPWLQSCTYALAFACAVLVCSGVERSTQDKKTRAGIGMLMTGLSCAWLIAPVPYWPQLPFGPALVGSLCGFRILSRALPQLTFAVPGRQDLKAGIYSTAQTAGLFAGAVAGSVAGKTTIQVCAGVCIGLAVALLHPLVLPSTRQ